jgi:SAM-dependent methyltransferase
MRRYAPATDRNREPIAAILAEELPEAGQVLEIASGTGQHCAWFAQRFPRLVWQPTDPDLESLVSITDWCADIDNVLPPVGLDASADEWPVGRADAILCINMVHISPWAATLGLMAGAEQLLGPGAPLILYGPYRRHDVPTAPSNEEFERSLKARNPEFGLRHVEDVAALATEHHLALRRIEEMPANNLMLVFRRES